MNDFTISFTDGYSDTHTVELSSLEIGILVSIVEALKEQDAISPTALEIATYATERMADTVLGRSEDTTIHQDMEKEYE